MALKSWKVFLIVIGGLERPTNVSTGKNDTNSYLWDKSTLNKTTPRNNPEYDTLGKEFGYASIWGGKRKRKRRRKPCR